MTHEELKKIDLSTVELTQELYEDIRNASTLGIKLQVVQALKERTDINKELFSKLEAITKKEYGARFMKSIAIEMMFNEDGMQ